MKAPARFAEILNERLSVQAWMDPRLSRLPGVQPLALEDWLLIDEAFAPQMAYRDWLLEHERDVVCQQTPQADSAAQELCELITAECGFSTDGHIITRPDGIQIDLTRDAALVTAARLTQMDLCILQDAGDAHVLTAGVMCFPSSWRLTEKMGRSLMSIHSPVAEYDARIAISVQRMFKAIRMEQPLWRANFLIYTDPDLHQPRREGVPKPIKSAAPSYIRVERQSFRRLPKTGAVVFGIHTSIIEARRLNEAAFKTLAGLKPDVGLG